MVKTINLISPFSIGPEHSTFDRAFVELYMAMWYKIIFWWESKHCDIIKEWYLNNIEFKQYKFKNKGMGGLKLIFNLIIKRKYLEEIFFLSFDHPHLVIFISLFFKKSIGIIHFGEGKWYYPLWLKKLLIYKYTLKNKAFVLGKWINLRIFGEKIPWIFHPISIYTYVRKRTTSDKLVFGFSRVKNYKKISTQNIDKLRTKILNLWWTIKSIDGNMNLKDYLKNIQTNDFLIFLSNKDAYSNRCSGTVFDSITNGVPVIGLTCKMFDDLEKDFGFIGYFFENITEMEKFIEKLLAKKIKITRTDHEKIREKIINFNMKKLGNK